MSVYLLHLFSNYKLCVQYSVAASPGQTIAMSLGLCPVPGLVVEDNEELLAECPRSQMQQTQLNAE